MPPLDAEDGQEEVVLDREAEEEARRLERPRQAEPGALARGRARHVAAEQLHAAGRRRKLARHEVEERRLPGPVRAQDRTALPRQHVEVHAGDRVYAPEAPADPPESEDRLGAWGLSSLGRWRRHGHCARLFAPARSAALLR